MSAVYNRIWVEIQADRNTKDCNQPIDSLWLYAIPVNHGPVIWIIYFFYVDIDTFTICDAISVNKSKAVLLAYVHDLYIF